MSTEELNEKNVSTEEVNVGTQRYPITSTILQTPKTQEDRGDKPRFVKEKKSKQRGRN